MTRSVLGYFQPHKLAPADVPDAPCVNVRVGDYDAGLTVRFLIDTGADQTLLSPNDAFVLLGWPYVRLDFAASASRQDFAGVGRGAISAMRHFASLALTATDRSEITFNLPIAVAEPIPPYPGEHGNWLMPSLLGRDILQHFDLHLSYHPPSVTLTEASTSS